ncbi:MAG TPA: hypothetical protein VKU02_21240 [Gemmataceae bacterium]|nr:hypothetical protein [Gemmataceae bacterium]
MNTKICFLGFVTSFLLSLPATAAEMRGIILKADVTKNQLTIEGRGLGVRGAIVTLQLEKDTQIQLNRKPAVLADLSPGRRVRVVYDVHGDQRVALLITLQGGPPSQAPSEMSPSGNANSVSGILRRVSFTEREIVVVTPAAKEGGDVEVIVSVPEDTKIAKDQKAIAFDELKEGDQVLVQIEKHDGKLLAKSIQLGAIAQVPANPDSGQHHIERIRKALKLIDFVLQMMAQKSK